MGLGGGIRQSAVEAGAGMSKVQRIALYDADGGKHPNLSLGKLAAWHRSQGDVVERFIALLQYDVVYASKVFSWTPDNPYLPAHTRRGGTGYSYSVVLPEVVEHMCPDYSFLGINYSLGFTTRGCPNRCLWCIVPQKEGDIQAHAGIEEFLRHKRVVLMDNNILAHPHGIAQLESLSGLGVRVDINQGLDARLIDTFLARLLASLKWIRFIRLACDSTSQMLEVEKAVRLLRSAGIQAELYCYVLVQDVENALERVEFLRALGVSPFAQPYRAPCSRNPAPEEQRRFARYVNHKAIFNTVPWAEYGRKAATV